MSKLEVITKRLHISGLTPQISAADLKTRFSFFGNVKALDGLGKLDSLGQPRPYAYVTLETTKSQMAKCLNVLSGTTWKGAKLRIGEAKPDFRERIKRENESVNEPDIRLAKRRRLARGVQDQHASDMSPVTQSSLRPGWRVTPLGRLVRPMRMRPLHPLPERLPVDAKVTLPKARKKKKNGDALVRARRRKIDPEEWGSTYLSGIMLEGGSGIILPENDTKATEKAQGHRSQLRIEVAPPERYSPQTPPAPRSLSASPQPNSPDIDDAPVNPNLPQATEHQPEGFPDLVQEKERTLAFLDFLFSSGTANGNSNVDDDDWGGRESLSDLDVDAGKQQQPDDSEVAAMHRPDEEDNSIEYVPRTIKAHLQDKASKVAGENTQSQTIQRAEETVTQLPSQTTVQTMSLKDMFAPRPEDAGFSILGNLDLELDDEIPPISAPRPIPPPSDLNVQQSIPTAASRSARLTTFNFDTKIPFFFPHSLNPHSPLVIKPGDPRDIFSRTSNFFRTESDEEIRARWESRKVELTRDWKRRHREAVKSSRRRGAVAQD